MPPCLAARRAGTRTPCAGGLVARAERAAQDALPHAMPLQLTHGIAADKTGKT